VAVALVDFLREQQPSIRQLLHHAETLAQVTRRKNLPFVLCHADIHVGNVLLTAQAALYVVDWDTLVLAPKERDLMFMGMGMGDSHSFTHDEQAALFYQGYGPVDTDRAALAFYRCERIVQDIDAYCQQILNTTGDSSDRRNGLRQLRSQFGPDGVVARALRSAEIV
jgi:spectinomycin phosphotransferase